MSSEERYDFIVYGATGFTGKFVVKEIVAKTKSQQNSLTWAVAGRSPAKLVSALKSLSDELGADLSEVDVLTASTEDGVSLSAMAKKARVVLNCVGPYRFHGAAVVKACVENGASVVDISGEPDFLERMELQHNSTAESAGVYVVGSCGFDSIPNDLGIVYTKQQFGEGLAAVETYMGVISDKSLGLNSGTWNTLVHGISNWKQLTEMRKQRPALPAPKPVYRPKLSSIQRPFGDDYYVPFMGADKSVVYRTQRDDYVANEKLPVSAHFFFRVGSLWSLMKAAGYGVLLLLMSLTSFGKSLLLKYPSLFSGGLVYEDGPPMDIVNSQKFFLVIRAKGFSSPEMLAHQRVDKEMTVELSGPDPGYRATSAMLVESAYTILRERDKMPGRGGVFTPGYAFSNSSIVERLNDRGISFKVVSKNF